MSTREQLNIFTPSDIQLFRPNLVHCDVARLKRRCLQDQFFSVLMDIIARHSGEQLLVVRRRDVSSYDERSVQAHLYLGLISSQVKSVRSSSDEMSLPTSRYVDSLKSLHPISRSNGNISEGVLGMNTIWLFFLKVSDTDHALDLYVGNEETDGWFSQPQRAGTFPYLRKDLLCALGYVTKPNENFPLQLFPA